MANTQPVTNITTEVMDGKAKIFALSFADDAGDAVVPDPLTYTLQNGDGDVVDSRDGVVLTPATSVTVVLSATCNSLLTDASRKRVMIIDWTYTSDAGSGIAAGDAAVYYITDKTPG
jgi:hypothetical protein